MTRAKRFLVVFLSVFSLLGLAGLHLAPVAYAGSTDLAKKQSCEGAGGTYAEGKCTVAGQANLDNIIRAVIGFFSILVGVASVVMVMVGGFKYITSGGDSGKASSAKSTIVYAIIGLVIAALAQIIVRFVIDTSTNPPDPNNDEEETSLVERV